MDTVRFYFSFRSPYAFLAHHRAGRAFHGLPVTIQPIPVFPPPDYPNDPAAVPAKLAYIARDAARIAREYGLPPFTWGGDVKTDWMRPHAAWVFASDSNEADAFARGVFAARFCDSRDVGADETLRDVGARCGLDPDAVVRAAGDPALHQRVGLGMLQAREDGIFGVPFFAWRDQRYWGNDRLEWLVRDIQRAHGASVPDLVDDPMARPSA